MKEERKNVSNLNKYGFYKRTKIQMKQHLGPGHSGIYDTFLCNLE